MRTAYLLTASRSAYGGGMSGQGSVYPDTTRPEADIPTDAEAETPHPREQNHRQV